MDSLRASFRSLLVVVAVVGAVLIGLAFARVAITAYDLQQQKQALEADLDRLRAENTALRARLAEIQTDQGIERLARSELGWTRPDETAVIIVGRATPTATVASPDHPGPPSESSLPRPSAPGAGLTGASP
ncbi:MAG: septum formation initiator family protein [Chloroflexi bacterium]|nr:septum formation initiator family protein [Chloroflexota bacterium]